MSLCHEDGPFDIIGDIHGCYDELVDLLARLGYLKNNSSTEPVSAFHPQRRRAVFLGDLVNRGPKIPQVLKLVMSMVDDGLAICVPGNHDINLLQRLQGQQVKAARGLTNSLEQLARESKEFQLNVTSFISSLVSHYLLDGGRLVVVHAGLSEEMHGCDSSAVLAFALFGEIVNGTDHHGHPAHHIWAPREYRGRAMVVYGHTPVREPKWLNRTINIDTGCVFGGRLTALRYPEQELISIAARRAYAIPVQPLANWEGRSDVATHCRARNLTDRD